MKRNHAIDENRGKKLVLDKQTIRELKPGELAQSAGGATGACVPKC
jgi:hypothetical protein